VIDLTPCGPPALPRPAAYANTTFTAPLTAVALSLDRTTLFFTAQDSVKLYEIPTASLTQYAQNGLTGLVSANVSAALQAQVTTDGDTRTAAA
jgi:hypothetical protein